MKFFRRLIAFAALLAIAVGLGILVPRPIAFGAANSDGPRDRVILLIENPIHTDIALPVDEESRSAFAFLGSEGLDPVALGAEWIVVGWGGRAFYLSTPTWADLAAGPVFKALTMDAGVMHVALAGAIDPADAAVRAIRLSEAEHDRLIDAVLASFSRDTAGEPMPIDGAGYGDFDRFYEGEGWFNVLVGCNLWTARMLRVAGLKTGFWTPLPVFLTASLDLHNDGARLAESGQRPVPRQP
ncbi:MAG: TIGR02117 family protein [Rhizobiales bacterium]|nr:TIGR02117 family protein [Hyphomicrobiales bacterium]